MPTVYISPFGGAGAQFFDNNGDPLSGGKISTYVAGTTTPQITYATSAGSISAAHSNPIILDAAGRVPGGEIWLTFEPYKFILRTSNDVLVGTYDNIRGVGASQFTPENFSGDGTTINFTLTNPPYNENSTNIYINGVYQQKNSYTVAGAVVTFSEAPPNTSSIEILYV